VFWACGALMAGFLAWKTKEEAITLPLAIAGFLFLRGHRRTATAVVIFPLLIVLLRFTDIAGVFTEVSENRRLVLAGGLPALKPGVYLMTHIAANVFYYYAKLILPVGLNADPTVKTVMTISDMRFILALLCMIGLAMVCVVAIQRKEILSFSLGVLLVSPLAAYSFMPLADVVAEHRAYIAVLGYALAIAAAIMWKPRYSGIAILLISMLLGVTTVLRNRVWADSLRLWSDTARKSPTLSRPHLNLGVAYQNEGRFDEALVEFDHALSINPRLAPALVNRGAIFFQRGELDRAEAELKKAIEVAPERAVSYLNLASIALARKQPEAALPWLEKSIALENTAVCRFTLGETLLQLGRTDAAAREFQRAAELSPTDPELGMRIELRLHQLRQSRQ
jgi:protein O-mannosyl-transferase